MIPLFKSHYSLGKSILTFDPVDKNADEETSDSIVDICVKNGLKNAYLVEDSMGGFLEAYQNLKEEDVQLRFGYRVTMVGDATDPTAESFDDAHKIVIFARNKTGFKKLVQLYTLSNVDCFYKTARLDYNILEKNWSEHLTLAIPFYDSFLFYNNLSFRQCVPRFDFADTFCFLESNGMPFDSILQEKVRSFAKSNKLPIQEAKSIYYKNKEDFKAWQTYKCMFSKSYRNPSLTCPNLDHCHSDEFCFESWLNENGNT